MQNLGSGPSPTSLQIDGNSVESVDSFVYLGSLQKSKDNSRPNMKRSISLAASVMSSLSRMWRDKILTNIRLYQTLVMSVFHTLQKLGHYFRVTIKRWRLSTWSANDKSCTYMYTGLSMSQTQKYPVALAYHLLWTPSEDVVCQYSAIARLTQGAPAHNALYIAKSV